MKDRDERPLSEEIQVRGAELVERVKALIQEGNVRRLVVRRPSGEALVEIPLTAGVGIAGLLTLMAPVLAALGAMAALIADFRVQIERDGPPEITHGPTETIGGEGPYEDVDGETNGDGDLNRR
jgi:Domain of unknown function (DUF4342)